jgi:beta-galactosidase/beta-glucuronidase
MSKRLIMVFSAMFAWTMQAETFEHVIYKTISLDGEWEMAYQPYAWETVHKPEFRGVMVKNAVPGYWEDMIDDFRAAGIKDEFRINPWYEVQTFPICGRASDTTLPQIYGCFFYRRIVEVADQGNAVLAFEGVRNQVHVWVNGTFVEYRAGFPRHLKSRCRSAH